MLHAILDLKMLGYRLHVISIC